MTTTVAIVTARRNDDIRYAEWTKLRKALLANPAMGHPAVNGELLALLMACLHRPVVHHIEYQLRALQMQTVTPDRILIVDRLYDDKLVQATLEHFDGGLPIEDDATEMEINWVEPMLTPRELDMQPFSALPPWKRENSVCFGCGDKNTALCMCETDHLIMLDDGCLPGPCLVELAVEACSRGNVLLLGHRQLYLPTDDQPTVRHADANWDGHQSPRCPFGIWAMPVEYALAVNGYNTSLDGKRGGLDLEFRHRLDLFAKTRGFEFQVAKLARVYELQHDIPWTAGDETDRDWHDFLPEKGWRAVGPDLSRVHTRYLEEVRQLDAEEEQQEEDDEEDFED